MGSRNKLNPFWCCRRDRKNKRGNQSTGLSKGCTAKPLIRYMCNHSRSYKLKAYPMFLKKCLYNNGRIRLSKLS